MESVLRTVFTHSFLYKKSYWFTVLTRSLIQKQQVRNYCTFHEVFYIY